MLFSFAGLVLWGIFRRGFFGGGLKVAHGLVPELIEVGAEAGDAFRAELVQTAGSGAGIGHKACLLEDPQVLGDGGARYGESPGELVDGSGAGGELLKDGHAGLVAEGVESGL
jgi:hypothetical protein